MAKKFTYITALLFFLFGIYMFNQEAGNKNSQNNSSIKEDSVILLRMPVNGVEKPGISVPSFYSTENFRGPVSNPRMVKTQKEDILISQNIRVHPSNGTQSETPIARDPSNHNILLGSANTWRGGNFISEGVYVSTDGGLSWSGSDTINSQIIENGHSGDPAPVIDKNGNMIMAHLTSSPLNGVSANYSTNNGLTWSQEVLINTPSSGIWDKDFTCTDDVPTSPFYGRCYCAWEHSYKEFISYTTNGGVNWAVQVQINQFNSFGIDLCCGPAGQLYAAWFSGNSHYGIGTSLNGAASWNVNEIAFNANSQFLFLPTKGNIIVNGLPRIACDKSNSARRGWIYVVAGYKDLLPSGSDPDIILHHFNR